MNPFDRLNANFDQNKLERFMLGQKMQAATKTQPTNAKPKGRGGTLTSLISEGGAMGGAAAGAALGSAVPVVGTAIGGILGAGLGAFGGRLAENQVRDARWGVGDAAKEGAISAALTGPLKLMKYGATTAKGLKAGVGLENALINGADDAAKFSLRGVIGKGIENKATKFATKQFGLGDGYIAKFTKMFKEDPGKVIQRYGFGSVDDITNQIGKQKQVFDTLVEGAGTINRNTLDKKLTALADDLLKQAPSDTKAMGQQLLAEKDNLLGQFGKDIPASALNAIKNQYDDLVNYATKMSNPAKHTVNKRVADGLRELVQEASGGSQLKSTGMELSKLINLAEEAGKRAPAVASRAASPLGFRNLLGGALGSAAGTASLGAIGGIPGMVAGYGLTSAANSPAGRKVLADGTNKLAQGLVKSGAKGVTPVGMALKAGAGEALRGILNTFGQPQANAQTLENTLSGGQSQSAGANNAQATLNAPTTSPTSMNSFNMPTSNNNPQDLSRGFTTDNMIKAMLLDLGGSGGKNIDTIKSIFSAVNPQQTDGLKLQNTAIARISDYQSGLQALDELQQKINDSNVNAPIIGDIRRKNPYDTGAQSLNSSIRAVRQLVGRALEGGVLRREDEYKYEQMLPKIGDTDAVAQAKLENVRALLSNNLQSFMYNQQYYSGAPQTLEDVYSTNQQQGAYY